ncbi:hypothetical protein LSH36_103g06063 [Paralvinella palmiformis]|uniref:Carbohydrate sulfotransferase n=1 Tax=Paralvinella palmiformis TaxID=53620 RepID=A0AAD9K0I2_9ANNE|nr:hypothetical protein LSH36_103g06063 [Paralvinella palmiformis]
MDYKLLINNRFFRHLAVQFNLVISFLGFIMVLTVMLQMLTTYSWRDPISYHYDGGGRSTGREEFVGRICTSRNWSRGFDVISERQRFWRLLADDRHNLLYCAIPKVACSSFKTYIAKATGKVGSGRVTVHSVRYLNSIGLGYLNQPITGNIDYKLTTYSKLIVVRHPFDRLMSAYSNKFVEEGYYSKAFAKHILKEFADRVTYDSHGIMRISLNQFLFLISKYYYRGFLDRHWQSYYDLCHPCDVHYDKIIKLETLDEDISAFTRHYTDDDTGHGGHLSGPEYGEKL